MIFQWGNCPIFWHKSGWWWLVAMNYIFPEILGFDHHPNWLSYVSEGWLNHQPVYDFYDFYDFCLCSPKSLPHIFETTNSSSTPDVPPAVLIRRPARMLLVSVRPNELVIEEMSTKHEVSATLEYGGFHSHWGAPIAEGFLLGKIPFQWMMTGVPPFMETHSGRIMGYWSILMDINGYDWVIVA